ncbi:MAG: hypothetical protein HPY55_09885 [Firmicutes bacterium]|nr:hypothetical protein [Bacillota bacterium]
MRLGIELLALAETHVLPHTYFEVRVSVNGAAVEESAGRDEFRSPAYFRPGERLAATGRINIWDEDVAPAIALRVRPAYVVPIRLRPGDRLGLHILTSLPVDQGTLQACLAARVVGGSRKAHDHLPFSHPGVRVDWDRRGRFHVDFGQWPAFPTRKGGEPA